MNPKKRKLVVVVGAGASIELGMPSVNEIDGLFCKWAKETYALFQDNNESLYSYIRDQINDYYSKSHAKLDKKTNFEEVLHVILQLSSALKNNSYGSPINAFLDPKEIPKTCHQGIPKSVDSHDLSHLACLLIDKLLEEFRLRCIDAKNKYQDNFEIFSKFINQLTDDYDTAFVSLNYDNLITQACNQLFTGFAKDGTFDPISIYERQEWNLIYHMHGSVHFNPTGDISDLHAIRWNANLSMPFQNNSSGRNLQSTKEGTDLPTSVIVAGYGKTNQIQRIPFRTYYSKVDELVSKSEALLFLGYGFGDTHINNAVAAIKNENYRRRKVIVTYEDDDQDCMQFRNDFWSYALGKTISFNANQMTEKHHNSPPQISKLKKIGEFEVSNDSKYPLSIWYGGFIKACKNYQKIRAEIDGLARKSANES